jgi:hypothetical protein
MKGKDKISNNLYKISKMISDNDNTPVNEEKTELDKTKALQMFEEKWRVRYFQLKQDYLLEKKQLLQRLNTL